MNMKFYTVVRKALAVRLAVKDSMKAPQMRTVSIPNVSDLLKCHRNTDDLAPKIWQIFDQSKVIVQT